MTDGVRTVSVRSAAVILWVGLVVSAGGGATTYGLFLDSEQTNGTFRAAASFDGTAPGNSPYNDTNDNGRWDSGESTYEESDLYNFDDPDANLVIPGEMGKVDGKNTRVDIRANSIQSGVKLSADNGVDLEATGGDVTVTGKSIKAKNGGVQITAAGDVTLDDTAIDGPTGNVEIRGATISVRNVDIRSKNYDVILAATEGSGGPLDANGASIRADTGDIALASNGEMNLDFAELRSKNGRATADLGDDSVALRVDATDIDDDDGILLYVPDGVTVEGAPNSGCVSSRNADGCN